MEGGGCDPRRLARQPRSWKGSRTSKGRALKGPGGPLVPPVPMTAHCPLPTTHRPLPTARYPLIRAVDALRPQSLLCETSAVPQPDPHVRNLDWTTNGASNFLSTARTPHRSSSSSVTTFRLLGLFSGQTSEPARTCDTTATGGHTV